MAVEGGLLLQAFLLNTFDFSRENTVMEIRSAKIKIGTVPSNRKPSLSGCVNG